MRYLIFLLLFSVSNIFAQDTFSIVAVDEATGEVGGAGATCLDSRREGFTVEVISDLLPGRGAIHTQAAYNSSNQIRARLELVGGKSPQEVMDYMVIFDAQNNPQTRQYGIVDFDSNGKPRAAAFTGTNCFDVKNHIVGDYYAIQGNILLDSTILDSMEANFLRTQGSLADKLMAAMQGAKIPGADSRCLVDGVSSRSAILKVAKRDDVIGSPSLDLHIPVTPDGVDPIDALQEAYDEWKTSTNLQTIDFESVNIKLYPNPTNEIINLSIPEKIKIIDSEIKIFDEGGKEIINKKIQSNSMQINLRRVNPGVYFAKIYSEGNVFIKRFIVK